MPIKHDSELCPQGLCKSLWDLIHLFIHLFFRHFYLSCSLVYVLPVPCVMPGSQQVLSKYLLDSGRGNEWENERHWML